MQTEMMHSNAPAPAHRYGHIRWNEQRDGSMEIEADGGVYAVSRPCGRDAVGWIAAFWNGERWTAVGDPHYGNMFAAMEGVRRHRGLPDGVTHSWNNYRAQVENDDGTVDVYTAHRS